MCHAQARRSSAPVVPLEDEWRKVSQAVGHCPGQRRACRPWLRAQLHPLLHARHPVEVHLHAGTEHKALPCVRAAMTLKQSAILQRTSCTSWTPRQATLECRHVFTCQAQKARGENEHTAAALTCMLSPSDTIIARNTSLATSKTEGSCAGGACCSGCSMGGGIRDLCSDPSFEGMSPTTSAVSPAEPPTQRNVRG